MRTLPIVRCVALLASLLSSLGTASLVAGLALPAPEPEPGTAAAAGAAVHATPPA